MYPNFDFILERKILNKKLVFWRIIAIIAIIMSMSFFINKNNLNIEDSVTNIVNNGDYIANIEITGEIIDNMYNISKISQLSSDNNLKAVIVNIDSPGGAPVQSEQIYLALREISDKKKPVIALIGGLGASGAYMVAIGADHIFAYDMSLVGSVGVIMSTFEVTELAEKLGIKPIIMKSSPLKASPNFFEKDNQEARSAIMSLIQSIQSHFIEMVRTRRLTNLNNKDINDICNGRIYSGSQALKMNLIDQIGGNKEARKYLEMKYQIKENTPLRKINILKKDKNSFPYEYLNNKINDLLKLFLNNLEKTLKITL
ncbi:signal peptide peptidase SppA [Lyticum sinuosum]|uniref:Signal peptide peptidase SppA n=1 Tax=Lyticum sinuosum TaxID=1332059 RepID=A0AAE5AHK4_9RICK|nr:signal peptide peptidase SppA [Lyticum sinuosum]MDZ5761131.1 Signal peptide peptidase SppA [Lyticum sinuosum]